MKTIQDSTQPVPEAPVERFEFECTYTGYATPEPNPEGRWVRYEDYEKLRQEYIRVVLAFTGFGPRKDEDEVALAQRTV